MRRLGSFGEVTLEIKNAGIAEVQEFRVSDLTFDKTGLFKRQLAERAFSQAWLGDV